MHGPASNNASPQLMSPDEAEEAEDAFVLLPDQIAPAATTTEPPSSETSITSLHSLTTKVTIARKASQTWKGFSLKKQLNRVKKNSLLPNREKGTAPANSSPTEESSGADGRRDADSHEDDITVVESSAHRAVSEKCAENAAETCEEGEAGSHPSGDDGHDGRLNRPADLPLFDHDGRPVRPPRQGQKKKPSGPVPDGGKRDTRHLSVPNLKHQKQEQPSLRDLRRKQQAASNQPSLGNLLIRRFSKWRSHHFRRQANTRRLVPPDRSHPERTTPRESLRRFSRCFPSDDHFHALGKARSGYDK